MGFSVIAVLGMALAGCDGRPADPARGPDAQAPATLFADVEVTSEVMGLWSRSCVLCHANGAAGAPRVGDRAAWGPRLEQGEDTLLAHTVEGYNEMPPLGYCMACNRDEPQHRRARRLRGAGEDVATSDCSSTRRWRDASRVHMRVNVEIDVGLHRGGVPEPEALTPLLAAIREDPEHLSLSGFMGYEPHLTGLGATLGHPAVSMDGAGELPGLRRPRSRGRIRRRGDDAERRRQSYAAHLRAGAHR